MNMATPRLNMCCSDAEKKLVRKLPKMTDEEVIAEFDRQYKAERLELLDRGFTQKQVWVKA
jgi:hypothetical protein